MHVVEGEHTARLTVNRTVELTSVQVFECVLSPVDADLVLGGVDADVRILYLVSQ